MALLIGVDIGGTNLRVGVVDDLKLVYEKRTHADFANLCRTSAPAQAWQQILQVSSAALQEAIREFPDIRAIGIGFPGFIDPLTSHIAQSPNLPGLSNVDLAGDLSHILGLPVIVENDALAAAYGEYQLLNNKLAASADSNKEPAAGLIYIGLGTGVGGGLIYGGKAFAGEHGVAMEIGHLTVETNGRLCGCGNYGCLEQYASASGVSISYQQMTGERLDADKIAGLAYDSDASAIAAYRMAAEYLAQSVAHIVKVIDVAQVIIGGGMSKAWPLMQPVFAQRLQRNLIPVLRGKIVINASRSGDQAGIIGAALLSARHSSPISSFIADEYSVKKH